ncbi:hypothetical protein LshimejAT787_0901960 [Lyophyllum shimeji]|uniref:Uncharacterized protein n=1 Tax=Lyophyllum shimeji TaxID=47721 RepID=A0A9P3PTI0_LYOSH|nr:hypothetical protein LshimejAT787_0901960 [Lyophyllum shimeji]
MHMVNRNVPREPYDPNTHDPGPLVPYCQPNPLPAGHPVFYDRHFEPVHDWAFRICGRKFQESMFENRILALALSVAAFCGSAAAVNCAVCPSSIFYAGLTRTLTNTLKSTGTLQCNYDSPPISGFSPYCLYSNLDGALVLTNTGDEDSISPVFRTGYCSPLCFACEEPTACCVLRGGCDRGLVAEVV